MKEPQLNALDRAISIFNPKAAISRLRARNILFAYDEGVRSGNRYRQTASSYQNTSSTSSQKLRDRTQIMWEARDLVDNSSLIKSILFRIGLYVCSKVRYQARTGDESVDVLIEEVWNNFCQSCDITGRHSFRKLCQLALVGMLRDGDFGFVIVNTANGIKLASIESDRIGSPYESLVGEGYIQGIFLNSLGQPVRYRIFNRTREGSYLTFTDYDAKDFIHILDPLRADGYRGISALDAAIASGTARDLYEILQNEKVATKWQSAQAAVIKKIGGEAGWDTIPEGGKRLEKVEAGTINYLEPNEDIVPFGVTRPSVTFTGFVQTLVREVCMSLGVPYGFFYDMSTLGGATARLESAQAQRAFEHFQNVLEDKFLNKIKNIVVARGITDGLIPNTPNWSKGIWQYGAHPTVDVGRESQANIAEMQSGLKTAADIYGEQGKDWQEEQEQIAKEKANMLKLADKYGLDPAFMSVDLKEANSAVKSQENEAKAMDQAEKDKADKEEKKSTEERMARAWKFDFKKKKKRCWKGYEPVPGKTPYSDGSCQKMKRGRGRPIATELPNCDHMPEEKRYRYLATIMRKRARRIMLKIHGREKLEGKHIDHIDKNPMNNSIENLRIRDASTNSKDNPRKD